MYKLRLSNNVEYEIPYGYLSESNNEIALTILTDETIETTKEVLNGNLDTITLLQDDAEIIQYNGYSLIKDVIIKTSININNIDRKVLIFYITKLTTEEKNTAKINYLLMMLGE